MPAPFLLAGAALGAGMGLIKSAEEKKKADAERKLAAYTALYSPWTGMKPQTSFNEPSTMGNVLQGGLSGAMMGGIAGQAMPGAEESFGNWMGLGEQEADTEEIAAAAPVKAVPVKQTAQATQPMPQAGNPYEEAYKRANPTLQAQSLPQSSPSAAEMIAKQREEDAKLALMYSLGVSPWGGR